MIAPPQTINKPNGEYEAISLDEKMNHLFKCMDDIHYFVNEFCFIQDKVLKRWIRFKLWDAQSVALETFLNHDKVWVLKTRQIGLTWTAVSYAVWHMIFSPIAEILVFSKTEREAKDILIRMKEVYRRLPDWMKTASVETNMKLEWKLSNGSRVKVLPSNAGDSYAATLIIFDEADHVQDFGSLYNRAAPAVEGGGKLFVISTVDKNTPSSPFKKGIISALNGESDTVGIFIPYDAHPNRDEEWYKRTRQDYIDINGTDDEFIGHYPRTPQDALKARTLDKFFPPVWIDRSIDYVEPEYIVGDSDYPEPPPEISRVMGLIVYESPRPDTEYILGCDPAEGGEQSNDTAITVMEARTFIEVAHLSGRIDATRTGFLVDIICQWYNDAGAMIERNNHGHTVIAKVLELGNTTVLFGLDRKFGWLTNVVGKPRMYDWTHDVLQQWAIVLRTQKTVLQLSQIQRATLKAPKNMMDDCADSVCLAVAAIMHRESQGGWTDYGNIS